MKTLENPHNNKENTILEIARALAIVSALSVFSALLLGGTWVVLGWMRFYGLETGVVAEALPLEITDYHNNFLNATTYGIDCYNRFFQGNSRFGSGLGLIAGSCFALLFMKNSPRQAKVAGVLMTGAIVAGRFCLSFTSSPAPFLVSVLLGSAAFFLISLLSREKLPNLPISIGQGKESAYGKESKE